MVVSGGKVADLQRVGIALKFVRILHIPLLTLWSHDAQTITAHNHCANTKEDVRENTQTMCKRAQENTSARQGQQREKGR